MLYENILFHEEFTGGFYPEASRWDFAGPTEPLKVYAEGWSMCLPKKKFQIVHPILKGVCERS